MHEQGQIMDSKEFYAPIITPYEAELAFSPVHPETSGPNRQDFGGLLEEQPQVSLATLLGYMDAFLHDGALHRFRCMRVSSHKDRYAIRKDK